MTCPTPSIARRAALGLAAALVATVFAPTARAEIIDRIVAKVNSEIVTLGELKRGSGPYLLAFGIEPDGVEAREDSEKIYAQILDDMINTRLLVQEARTLQLEVGDADVDQWIQNITSRQGLSEDQFRTALDEKGIRWGDYRRYVKDNLLKFRVVQIKVASKVKVSDDELVAAYVDTHNEDPGQGVKTVDISHIFLPIDPEASPSKTAQVMDLANSTYDRVKSSGATFADVAKEVSAGPTAADGGFLGTYRAGELGPEIDAAVFKTEAGGVTKPVRVSKGVHIFRVHDVRSERDPKVEKRLQALRVSLREKELNKQLGFWIEALRQKAYVRVLL